MDPDRARQNIGPDLNKINGSNLFDTQMVFLKEFFEEVDFEKNQQRTKKHEKFAKGERFHLKLIS